VPEDKGVRDPFLNKRIGYLTLLLGVIALPPIAGTLNSDIKIFYRRGASLLNCRQVNLNYLFPKKRVQA
jgi:hypothetical protein